MAEGVQLENRIVELEREGDPSSVIPHPRNAREHPPEQRAAMDESLGRLGWIDAVIVNVRTKHVLDGHDRQQEALDRGETIPILWVDVAEEDEAFVLATFDPISAMATYNPELLDGLLEDAGIESESLVGLLRTTLDDLSDLAPDELPEEDQGSFSGDGTMLAATAALIGAPKHEVHHGQVWSIFGRHTMVIGDVMRDHVVWAPMLTDETLLLPYPGPYIMQTRRQDEKTFLLVQPDLFIAGMILDAAEVSHPELPAPVLVES